MSQISFAIEIGKQRFNDAVSERYSTGPQGVQSTRPPSEATSGNYNADLFGYLELTLLLHFQGNFTPLKRRFELLRLDQIERCKDREVQKKYPVKTISHLQVFLQIRSLASPNTSKRLHNVELFEEQLSQLTRYPTASGIAQHIPISSLFFTNSLTPSRFPDISTQG